jgi:D-amino-acid dehydrogenase
MKDKNIAVVGAGISGLMAAYFLTREGYSVTVFEQERYPAMRTSFANGGQISVSNSEVWTTWSNVKKGFKWMFKKDAPLLIRPTPEWRKIKWMAKFLWNTITNKYEENTRESIRLGIESRQLYKQIIEEENIKFDYSPCGILHFYKDEEYFEKAKSVKNIYESNGVEWDVVSNEKLWNIDSSLNSLINLKGSIWTPSDSVGDIHKFCVEIYKVLDERYGVKFLFKKKISSLSDIDIHDNFNKIIISNGVGAVDLANSFGDDLPIYPVKGYSITIHLDEESKKYVPKVSLLDDKAKIVTSTLGNRFRVAGTAELTGENYDIRRDRIQPLIDWVHENFPEINTRNYSSWACLRPMTPDMMPIIKQSKINPRVFFHTGHGHLGWTYSPATAKKLIKEITGKY